MLGIRDELLIHGLGDVEINAWVRTGDTPQIERAKMRRKPPHIVVTTPESLYLLLTSDSGRQMLNTVRTVIVDEIHSLAGNKRGAHLSLSLERLTALCRVPPVRIGLSATQRPLQRMAGFLSGTHQQYCTIINTGHVRERDLAIEVTDAPLGALMSNEEWQLVYDRLTELINAHSTTLIFVNTRRLAERAARFLAERIGDENVTAHHGSLAKEHRLDAEQRLKSGQLKALIATASLELGIDIGDVDLVCQLGSPHSIAAFLQRVGRSGHAVNATPKGRLFPLSRDDLVECTALMYAIQNDTLDSIHVPPSPADVLAQQIVAETACREWDVHELYKMLQLASPYKDLSESAYLDVVQMLSDGYSTRRGRRAAFLHYDRINGQLRARRGAKLTAVTNGGAIPDQFDFDVLLSPDGTQIGTLNEDFAFESLPGDIFQLGNTSYRILKVQQGKVFVQDAQGQLPTIPFWFGEAPGRTDELSTAVSTLRQIITDKLQPGSDAATQWLIEHLHLQSGVAQQLIRYLDTARHALSLLPTQEDIVLERFLDQRGDMHLVIHSPYGSRLNRAWGLALRKRFCRKFNFELQAAALEDSVVLSLGATHSFQLEEVWSYLKSQTVRKVLTQALLDSPMFATRWRWNATIALAVRRSHNGKKAPPQFQRIDAEDLMAVIFPDQLACLENIAGEREIPDHPLVNQCIYDCLHITMDINGLETVLKNIEAGRIRVHTQDLAAPSPLAEEILNARPYAFLDDVPAEERRTLAVQTQRFTDPADAARLGQLDNDAIQRVRDEIRPDIQTSDDLHDALVVYGFLTDNDLVDCATPIDTLRQYLGTLAEANRATCIQSHTGRSLWISAERLEEMQQLFPNAPLEPPIAPAPSSRQSVNNADEALKEIIRSRLELHGPITSEALSQPLALPGCRINTALTALEQEGFVIQGHFSSITDKTDSPEWCERRLLMRIHRFTLNQLRREVVPVDPACYMRFLFHWHGLAQQGQGKDALLSSLRQLEGFAAPAAAWETGILTSRIQSLQAHMLDSLCTSGHISWLRLASSISKAGENSKKVSPIRTTPIVLIDRQHLHFWQAPINNQDLLGKLSSIGWQILEHLKTAGASFFIDLVQESGLLSTQVETGLSELAAYGLVTSDHYAGLRNLITPQRRRSRFPHKHQMTSSGLDQAGRWSAIRKRSGNIESPKTPELRLQHHKEKTVRNEHIARILLRRYGIVFRKVLERETHIPPWYELLYVYRRMEARGEIRGGRFLQGFSGEQFALIDAIAPLRKMRGQTSDGKLVTVAGCDPLNLTGIITPGKRVTSNIKNQILYRDGEPVATMVRGEIIFLQPLSANIEWNARNLLIRRGNPSSMANYPRAL